MRPSERIEPSQAIKPPNSERGQGNSPSNGGSLVGGWRRRHGHPLSRRQQHGRRSRFFNKLKQFRAIDTRYDKLAKTFLAGVQLACATILLK
jgi:transposase